MGPRLDRSAGAAALALALLACAVGDARAQASCFSVERGGHRASSSLRVTLASGVRTRRGCEYALSPDGPFHALDAEGGPRGFAAIAAAIASEHAAAPTSATAEPASATPAAAPSASAAPASTAPHVVARPRSLYARPSGATSALSSIFLASCSDYLLSGDHGFSSTVPVETQAPRIARLPAPRCDADALSLRFQRLPKQGPTPPPVATGPWTQVLPVGEASTDLPAGRWAVYAGREGDEAALLLGLIDSGSSLTPLRAALETLAREPATEVEPWLRATWASGTLELEPTSERLRTSDAWAELRSAAASNAAWMVRERAGEREILGPLAMVSGGKAIRLPPGPLEEQMRVRYGAAGASMVPTLDDWNGTYDGLSLCVAPRYPQPGPGIGAPPPPGAPCVAMARLMAPLAVRGGATLASGQVCTRRRVAIMTAAGPRPGPELGEQCFSLPSGAAGETAPALPLLLKGDQLTFSGADAARLFVCNGDQCRPMPTAGDWMPLSSSGLYEIRHAERAEGAATTQGLTLLRLGVIDPATEWHPVGLYDADPTLAPPRDRWTALAHDEDDVFAYQRGHHQLAFGLSLAPSLGAAYDRSHTERVGPQLPLLVRSADGVSPPPGAALEAVATLEPTCPAEPAREVRAEALNPDGLPVDRRFYVHLAHYRGDDRPFDCLARAGFRVTEQLTRRATSKIRVGLLGDVQALVFLNRPAAVGAALPLAQARWRWVYGLGLDASASLLAAVTLDEAAISRAGAGISAMVYWGPEGALPRLLSAGAMVHLTEGNGPRDEPTFSFLVGLDLATLVDAVGGR